ncbi:hypothetical protein LZ30DRAFT_326708 [Colletotrichum cereale]|nr:hypothetical protein LZ30DRAFT_326708 [Colletotrichum cereale]
MCWIVITAPGNGENITRGHGWKLFYTCILSLHQTQQLSCRPCAHLGKHGVSRVDVIDPLYWLLSRPSPLARRRKPRISKEASEALATSPLVPFVGIVGVGSASLLESRWALSEGQSNGMCSASGEPHVKSTYAVAYGFYYVDLDCGLSAEELPRPILSEGAGIIGLQKRQHRSRGESLGGTQRGRRADHGQTRRAVSNRSKRLVRVGLCSCGMLA